MSLFPRDDCLDSAPNHVIIASFGRCQSFAQYSRQSHSPVACRRSFARYAASRCCRQILRQSARLVVQVNKLKKFESGRRDFYRAHSIAQLNILPVPSLSPSRVELMAQFASAAAALLPPLPPAAASFAACARVEFANKVSGRHGESGRRRWRPRRARDIDQTGGWRVNKGEWRHLLRRRGNLLVSPRIQWPIVQCESKLLSLYTLRDNCDERAKCSALRWRL